jgi:crooked neck
MFHGDLVNARAVYERAVEYFGEDNMDPDLCLSFAKFEESCKEHERARAIYQLALAKIPKAR